MRFGLPVAMTVNVPRLRRKISTICIAELPGCFSEVRCCGTGKGKPNTGTDAPHRAHKVYQI